MGSPKRIFEKKIEKCKKGDEITRFDGSKLFQDGYHEYRTYICDGSVADPDPGWIRIRTRNSDQDPGG